VFYLGKKVKNHFVCVALAISSVLLAGCGSNPTTIVVGNGLASFAVVQTSPDEFELTLSASANSSRTPELLAAAYDQRAKALCGDRAFEHNAANAFESYTSPGAFGSTNRHSGMRRFGRVTCKSKP
jgi:hypothetical protein